KPETVFFHVEVEEPDDVKEATLTAIRAAGSGAGLAISPATPVEALLPFMSLLDAAMVMTVVPGFGGQKFLPGAAPKMAVLAAWFRERADPVSGTVGQVHVDGGVNRETARLAGHWGADVLVVGSALFQRGHDAADEVQTVRERADVARRDAALQESAEAAEAAAVAATARPAILR
ncbi:MAG: hypothetical protein ABIZ34_04285, partial [Candidatus Limnocylindrales bacterium]